MGSVIVALTYSLLCGFLHRSLVLPSPSFPLLGLISIPKVPPPPHCLPVVTLHPSASPSSQWFMLPQSPMALFFTRVIIPSRVPASCVLSVLLVSSTFPIHPGFSPHPPSLLSPPLIPSPSFPECAYRWGAGAHAQGVRRDPGGCSDTAAHPAGSGCQA